MQTNLPDLVRIVGHMYRTIDIRFAALVSEYGWRNSFAIVRLTRQESQNKTPIRKLNTVPRILRRNSLRRQEYF